MICLFSDILFYLAGGTGSISKQIYNKIFDDFFVHLHIR